MFGQKPGMGFGSGFGTNTSSSFGSSTPFGQNNNTFGNKPAGATGFGAPSFGSSTPATGGLFGGNNNTTAGAGLFGQNNTNTFGNASTGFNFGGTPSTSSGGAGGLFGQTQTQSAGGLFSTPQSTNSAFGAKTPGFGGFGNTTSTASGLFGQQPQANTGGMLFGQGASAGGFGGNAAAASAGTTVKFAPPNGQDTMMKNGVSQNINTRHQCITAMKEYEAKSLEELRMEDYQANRKGKQAGGLFGATPATSNTGFSFGGQQQQQAQQTPSTGFAAGFGAQTSTAGSTGLFGQTGTAASGGLFGQNKPLFGGASTATTASTTGFGFGNTSQASGLFGQAQQQNKTLFGAAATQPSLFGATSTATPATSFSFGNTAGFGAQTQSGGLFGNKPAGFGTATTASTGFFGAGGNLFANKPTTTASFGGFGANTNTAGFGGFGGFGSSATAGGTGLFGNKPAGFGTNTSTLGTAGTGAFNFGNTQPQAGGLFGNTQNKPTSFGFNNFNTAGTAATTGFTGGLGAGIGTNFSLGGNTSTLGTQSNPAASNNQFQQQLLALASSPFGDSPLFWNLKQNSEKREEVLKPTNPAAQKAVLSSSSQYKVSPRPTAKIKPKSLHSLMNGSKSQLFDGMEDEDFSFGNETFLPRRSVKKLTLKKANGDTPDMSRASSQTDEQPDYQAFGQDTPRARPLTRTLEEDLERAARSPDTDPVLRTKSLTEPVHQSPIKDRTNLDDTIAVLNAKKRGLSGDTSSEFNKSPDDKDPEVSIEPQPQIEEVAPHPTGIVQTRPGYYTNPTLDELVDFIDENGDCIVDDFTIGRENYGSLFFPGTTNVANLNLDEIVHFRRKEVIVYPDDDKKPLLGDGLNKSAEVTLDCVWPNDKTSRSPIKDCGRLKTMSYQTKIEEITAKIGAKFIDYRPETGSWVFQVKHFSKYGLVDDSDEEEVSESDKKKLKVAQQQQLAIQKLKIAQENLQKQKQVDPSFEGQGLAGKGGQPPKEGYEAGYLGGMEEEEDADMPDITMERFTGEMMEGTDDDLTGLSDTPSSHRLASSLGVSAHNMQVMKASFFGEEDYQEDFKGKLGGFTAGQSLLKPQDKSVPSLFSPALKSKYSSPLKLTHSPVPQDIPKQPSGLFSAGLVAPEPRRPTQRFAQPPLADHMLLNSGLTQHDTPRKIVGSRVRREIPAVDQSKMYEKQKLVMDAGCFMGRSFRVGWGPGWTLVHSGFPSTSTQKEEPRPARFSLLPGIQGGKPVRAGSKAWTVSLEKMNVAEYLTGNDKTVTTTNEELLDIQLENSRRDSDTGGPVFVPDIGVEALHQYAKLGEKLLEENSGHPDESSIEHMRMVWNLCVALWGNLPEFRYSDTDEYAVSQARREAFSRWLSESAQSKIKEEVQEAKFKTQGHLTAIISFLSGRQITDACMMAQKSGDHRLALSLAQSVGSHVSRQMLARQLEEWAELGANHFINTQRLKIYSLLSGQLVWTSSRTPVNTCDHMDWKRALALHLWFQCKPNASIPEALSQFEDAFKGRTSWKKYANTPLPPYLEDDETYTEEEEAMDETDDHAVRDTCYHLLKLYCQKGHRLERILNPTTSTANQLDYRLSWHLSQVMQSLTYRHLSPYHAASIHTSFAAQLEALYLWHWAVFVLLHVEDPVRRESAVRSVLERHISLDKSAKYLHKEEFVRERLQVPETWIHHAKAIKARSLNRTHEEAWHLLKAQQWNEAHQVILTNIAADAIINENFDYLRRYLEELSPPEINSSVLNWSTGGKVFLDYINLCNRLDELKQGEPSPYDLEKLQPEVTSLCNRVGSLSCSNSKERLCQSEMAKKSANLLRTLLTLSSPTGRPQTRLMASHISNLPMPEDYSLQELRELTRSHLLEMTL